MSSSLDILLAASGALKNRTSAQDRVELGRFWAAWPKSLPAIRVYSETEDADVTEGTDQLPSRYRRALEVSIEVTVQGWGPADSPIQPTVVHAVHGLLLEIENILFNDVEFDGLTCGGRYVRTDFGFSPDGRQLSGAARIVMEYLYETSVGCDQAPVPSDLGTLKQTHVDYDFAPADGVPDAQDDIQHG